MAISFSKSLSETNLLNAYNNNIVKFSSDSVLDSSKCEITIDGIDEPFEITPIDNVFRFNFREVVSVLINSSEFYDNITPSLSAGVSSSHVYDDTDNTYLEQSVTFTITLADDSNDSISKTYKFLKSVEQLEQYQKGVVTDGADIYMLSTFQKETNNTYNITYFEGYPFDISLYLETPGTTTITNNTNALTYDFPLDYNVNRLFFSDGRITITIDNFLPLIDGLNELEITSGENTIYINVTKIPSQSGNYLKWINQYGGWSYWLFNCIHKRKRKISNGDEIYNDFDDVSETTTPFKNYGVESTDTLTLVADRVDEEAQEVINSIFDSPRVYYFTGERLTQIAENSWIGTKITSSSDVITDYKRKVKKYEIDIQLPTRYTMSL